MRRAGRRALLALLVVASLASPSATANANEAARAQMLDADDGSEYWDLTVAFDSGDSLFARFLITNAGPGAHTAVAVGHVVSSGTVTEFHNGRRRGRWELSSDRLRLDVGSSHFDFHGDRARYQITKDRVAIDLSFPLEAPRRVPARSAPKGQQIDLLALASPVEGTMRLAVGSETVQIKGRAALVHTVSRASEPKHLLRRLEFLSLDADPPLYFVHFEPTKKERTRNERGRTSRLSWGVVRIEGETTEFQGLETTLQGQLLRQAELPRGYWVPGEVQFSGTSSPAGQEISGVFSPGALLLQQNPLGMIPQPFRWWISLSMEPLRVWARSPFEVTIRPQSAPPAVRSPTPADQTHPLDPSNQPERPSGTTFIGEGVTTIGFLNPVPRPRAALRPKR